MCICSVCVCVRVSVHVSSYVIVLCVNVCMPVNPECVHVCTAVCVGTRGAKQSGQVSTVQASSVDVLPGCVCSPGRVFVTHCPRLRPEGGPKNALSVSALRSGLCQG